MSKVTESQSKLDWSKIKDEVDKRAFWVGFVKAQDILISNPLVPVGVVGTVVCLFAGMRQMMRGDIDKQHMWMRRRIGFHLATFLLASGSIFLDRREKGQPFLFRPPTKAPETIQNLPTKSAESLQSAPF